jgi:hypothetical protein
MKRRDVLKGIMLPLAVILAVALGCENNFVDPVEKPVAQPVDQGVLIGPLGGVVTAMEGNVEITIPAGAITDQARFIVHEVMNKSVRNQALKTIVIEPFVVFQVPVQIALMYDGCLGNGVNVCDAKSVYFSIWDDEACYIQGKTPKVCSSCTVNKGEHTVCMCICQTGVIETTVAW